jgi:apolipoprotein N-acyltransferase
MDSQRDTGKYGMKLWSNPWKMPPESQEERRMRRARSRVRVSLSILSGLMLGFAFPPSHLGILACFGLIPLLVVLADLDDLGSTLRYSYLTLLIFHIITLAWTGGYAHGNDRYMMIAGAITMLAHPFFYFLPIGAYWWIKKELGAFAGLIAFPLLWLGYEYSHTLSEWSFPWLTLGHTQTYDLARMQIVSVTGVWGLSLWVLLMNVVGFILYSQFARGLALFRDGRAWAILTILVVLYALPRVYGDHVLAVDNGADPATAGLSPMRIGIVQSNIDPWDKWSKTGYDAIRIYLDMTEQLMSNKKDRPPDIVLWPETAVPYYILEGRNRTLLDEIRRSLNAMGASVLTGFPQVVFYPDSTKASPSSKRDRRTGERYDTFNAAAFIQPGETVIPWYGKMKMVPLAERVPYADIFHFVDFLRWDVGIGGWQIGRDTTVFVDRKTGSRFSTLICYESVYPDFVATFVRKGAEFLTIITIDSWWGRMSGAFQHQQFALLRAIENRRWIARCAVGGISCFIDPFGRTYDKTEMFTKTTIVHNIGRSTILTLYSRYGDWLPLASLWVAGAFLAAALGSRFLQKKRAELWTSFT